MWVWVKIRYSNNWMVSTKLDSHLWFARSSILTHIHVEEEEEEPFCPSSNPKSYYPAGGHIWSDVRTGQNWPVLQERQQTKGMDGFFCKVHFTELHSLMYDKICDLSIIYHDD